MASAIDTLRNPSPGARVLRLVGRFVRNERGVTAIEFSFVALPFFALMFAILETALSFFAQNYFEDTLARVSRQVRTGQAQKTPVMTVDQFKTALCAQLTPVFDCPGGVTLDIRTYANFNAASTDGLKIPTKTDTDGKIKLDTSNTQFVPGKGGDIVVVRAYYSWPVFVNRLGNNLANMPDGTHLMVATTAFRNEPFPW